jgi:hypothetical protein
MIHIAMAQDDVRWCLMLRQDITHIRAGLLRAHVDSGRRSRATIHDHWGCTWPRALDNSTGACAYVQEVDTQFILLPREERPRNCRPCFADEPSLAAAQLNLVPSRNTANQRQSSSDVQLADFGCIV